MEDIQGEYDILTILNVTSDVCIEKENMSIKMFFLPNKAFKETSTTKTVWFLMNLRDYDWYSF